jgi:energy-coupling factor transport system permease protein
MRDVRSKLSITLCLSCGVLASRSDWYLAFAVALLVSGSVTSQAPPRLLLRRAWSVRWFLLAIIALNALTLPGSVIAGAGGVYLTREGALNGALQSARILVVLWSATLLMFTSPLEEMMDAAEQWSSRRGRPLVAVGVVTLTYLPLLVECARRVRAARRARGIDDATGPLSGIMGAIASALPLFAIALRNADALADAMESRGYAPGAPRTPFRTLRMPPREAGVLVAVVTLTVAAFTVLP